MWLGLDDTDGPSGGCTTFVLTEILRVARARHVDLIGAPRLVRLNPNIPWKTRGNAALSARFGRGTGSPRPIGRFPEGALRAFPGGRPIPDRTRERFLTEAWDAVLAASDDGPRSDPAMVAFDARPPGEFYYQAVRSVVRIAQAREWITRRSAEAWTRGSSRGLVGATAAVAWPGRVHTWELIGYRLSTDRSRSREIDTRSVLEAEARFPSLFQCFDPTTRRLLIAPHTPCPVLLGLRSTDPRILPAALDAIRSEPLERWVLFRTNQGTGDHLVDRAIPDLLPYQPGRFEGRVSAAPERRHGGHVRLRIADATGAHLDCWAFEPTKVLPRVARGLAIGDQVVVWGGRGRDPAFRLEGIEIRHAPPRPDGLTPPRCPVCARTAGSLGTGRGYRCPTCRTRFPPESARPRWVPAEFGPGIYHPTPSARRHLHPLPRRVPVGSGTPK
ncbi:MAG: tRNA(Ile)(2)-agmatinylcytidine synthase [Thermoplasmata archaeon]|nr:tRNA(Ile)(2)-agmatinylcytidine synthase [Thermoplasmata archaeon]MCI4359035.1 tRNA(Ile)(2)-agmatinylcytidine synthase [Thermoplasmata archaeon]